MAGSVIANGVIGREVYFLDSAERILSAELVQQAPHVVPGAVRDSQMTLCTSTSIAWQSGAE